MFRWRFMRLAVGQLLSLSNVKVSRRCADQIKTVNESQQWTPQKLLRMRVVPGGCHGFSYEFEFVDNHDDNTDVVLRCDDEVGAVAKDDEAAAKVVIDKKSLGKLQNATIDFFTELKGSAFVVVGNELVDETCACGQSFSVRKRQKQQQQQQQQQQHSPIKSDATPPPSSETRATPTTPRRATHIPIN